MKSINPMTRGEGTERARLSRDNCYFYFVNDMGESNPAPVLRRDQGFRPRGVSFRRLGFASS